MDNTRVITSIGICGCGKMGVSFYKYLLRFQEYGVVCYARDISNIAVVKGKKSGGQSSVRFTDRIEDLGDCDIVFEFVAEDLAVKREVTRNLFAVRKNQEQIVATGSSSFVPSRITDAYDTHNLIGVHFIYPIQIINTVEVVYGRKTPPGLVKWICDFLCAIGKTPVAMDEGVGCITTRVLAVLGNEAYRLHRQYRLPLRDLDDIIDESGYTPAPFDLQDTVGLDTIYNCISGHYEGRPGHDSFEMVSACLREKLAQGRLGKKSGRGFFDYRGNKEEAGVPGTAIAPAVRADILERIKLLYVNTAFQLVEKCFADCNELDGIFYEINGTGNGPARTLFLEDARTVVAKLKVFAREYGALFAPLRLLAYVAENGAGREDIDRQIRDFRLGGKRPDWCAEDSHR